MTIKAHNENNINSVITDDKANNMKFNNNFCHTFAVNLKFCNKKTPPLNSKYYS